MDIILFNFNAVVPLFVIVAVGYFLNRIGMMPEDRAIWLNRVCFNVMIPCSLFKTTYNADFSLSSFYLVAYGVTCYLAAIPLLCRIIPKWIPSRPQAGSVIQAIYRSNMVLIGIPLMTNLFGEEQVAPMALLITFMVPLFNISGTIVLTTFSRDAVQKPPVGHFVKKIVSNPMIIASLLGIAMNLLRIPLPVIITKPISDLAAIASPLAMMALGARFDFKSFSNDRFAIVLGTAGRLIILPMCILLGAVLLGFRGPDLCSLFICAAAPMAVANVAMADAMGCDGDLAGELLISTSACSCVTMFLWLCILQAAGLI